MEVAVSPLALYVEVVYRWWLL